MDDWSLKFTDLKKNFPSRIIPIWRYKVKNFNTTLNEILATNQRNIVLFLEEEKELQVINSNYLNQRSITSIGSGQEIGASKLENNEQITVISDELLPDDYLKNFYVYSFERIPEKTIDEHKIFIDNLAATHFPNLQVTKFKSGNNYFDTSKVKNVFSLTNLKFQTNNSFFKIFSYLDNNLDYVDGFFPITIKTEGLIGIPGIETKFINAQNETKILTYKLKITNRKYLILHATPTTISPNLKLSCITFDENRNINFRVAKKFINFNSVKEILEAPNFATKFTEDILRSLFTIIFLANQRLVDFKDYRIQDEKSPNFRALKFPDNLLFGIDGANLDSIPQKEISERILKNFESTYQKELENEAEKNQLQNVKGFLSSIGELVPSLYSLGEYKKINRLINDWYFIFDRKINEEDLKDPISSTLKIKLQSLKYDFKNGGIDNIKDIFTFTSNSQTFNLDGKITLPTIPKNLTAESVVTLPGNVDLSNNNFLNYFWIFQILDQSKYAQILEQKNKYFYSTPTKKNKTIENTTFNLADGEYKNNEIIRDYINKNLISSDGVIDLNFEVFAEIKTQRIPEYKIEYINGQYPSTTITFINKQITRFVWYEKIIVGSANSKPTKSPYNLDLETFQDFQTNTIGSYSTFELEPIIKQSGIKKIKEIDVVTTFSEFLVYNFKVMNKDGTTSNLEWRLPTVFKDDNSITSGGLKF